MKRKEQISAIAELVATWKLEATSTESELREELVFYKRRYRELQERWLHTLAILQEATEETESGTQIRYRL